MINISYMDSMGMWVSFVLKVLFYRMNCVSLFSFSWGREENCTYPINQSKNCFFFNTCLKDEPFTVNCCDICNFKSSSTTLKFNSSPLKKKRLGDDPDPFLLVCYIFQGRTLKLPGTPCH